MKKLTGNLRFMYIRKMIGHGYYLYPFPRKTILSEIAFKDDVTTDGFGCKEHHLKVQFRFTNDFFSGKFIYTPYMTVSDANDFMKRHLSVNVKGMYRRMVECADIKKERIGMPLDGVMMSAFGYNHYCHDDTAWFSHGAFNWIKGIDKKLNGEQE